MATGKLPEQGDAPQEKQEKWFGNQMQKSWFQVLVFLSSVMLYLLLVVALWLTLEQYMDPQGSSGKKDLVQALGLIMAGVASVIGIFYTWRAQSLTQEA